MGILERVSEDRKEAAKRVDILALAERYTQLRRKTTDGEYEGPCPKCGGTKRFTVHEREHWWFCRDCHPKWSDTIEFVRWMQPGLTFVEAVEQLTGESVPAPATKRKPAPAPQKAQQSTDWRSKAEKIVKAAQDRLWTAEGEPASAYLLRRGLEPHTWLQYGLGYCLSVALPNTKGQQRSPAISIPWYAGGKLVALRYRFLEVQNYIDVDGKERSEKVTAEHGSQFAGRLYGGHALPDWMLAPAPEEYSHPVEKLCTLLIVEGEINCMSCWQVASETNLHVLSLGSEGQQIPPAAMPFIRRYGQVLVWADREQIAQGLMGSLPGAVGIHSPGNKDANDLLQAGLLGGFLFTMRANHAKSQHEIEGLLRALYDAAKLPGGIDAGSTKIMGRLAAQLGKEGAIDNE